MKLGQSQQGFSHAFLLELGAAASCHILGKKRLGTVGRRTSGLNAKLSVPLLDRFLVQEGRRQVYRDCPQVSYYLKGGYRVYIGIVEGYIEMEGLRLRV